MLNARIAIPYDAIAAFCQQWRVAELALFGSVLRDDFTPESDIDVLVTFEPDAPWTLFDLASMQAELVNIFGREVDLVERAAIENSYNKRRRRAILESAQVLYVA